MERERQKKTKNLIGVCLEVLKNLKCCQVEFDPREAEGRNDGLVRLVGPTWEIRYALEVKRGISGQMTAFMIDKLSKRSSGNLPVLLFTDYVHEQLAENLRDYGIEFVDLAGNAYLNQPSLYIHVTGRKRTRALERPALAFQATGLKLIFLLLKRPEAINFKYRDLAKQAGIALGSTGSIIGDLRAGGFVRLVGRGRQRRLVNSVDLFSRWEMGYVERLRAKLFLGRYRVAAGGTFDSLIQNIHDTGNVENLMLGGELGAMLLTEGLRPEKATLHFHGDSRKITTQLRLIPDPKGTIDLLHTFGTNTHWEERKPRGCALADPLLIHAELGLSRSERLKGIAEEIHNGYILQRLLAHDQS
jgi:hypothetical protein